MLRGKQMKKHCHTRIPRKLNVSFKIWRQVKTFLDKHKEFCCTCTLQVILELFKVKYYEAMWKFLSQAKNKPRLIKIVNIKVFHLYNSLRITYNVFDYIHPQTPPRASPLLDSSNFVSYIMFNFCSIYIV